MANIYSIKYKESNLNIPKNLITISEIEKIEIKNNFQN